MFDLPCAAAGEAQNSKIGLFRSAARKNYLVWFRAEQTCQPVARVVNRSARLASGGVNARWITELFLKKRQHRRSPWLTQRRRGVVIEINHPPKLPFLRPRRRGRFCTMCNCVSS